jgi:hypothetical protein
MTIFIEEIGIVSRSEFLHHTWNSEMVEYWSRYKRD